MLDTLTADIDEVAAAIGRKPSWLKRNWLRFHQAQGFPRPLPGGGWRWPRRAVEQWLVAGGFPQASIANDNAPTEAPDVVEMQRDQFLGKYGARH